MHYKQLNYEPVTTRPRQPTNTHATPMRVLGDEHEALPALGLPELGRCRIFREDDKLVKNDIRVKVIATLKRIEAFLHYIEVLLIAVFKNGINTLLPNLLLSPLLRRLVPLCNHVAHTTEVEVAAAHGACGVVLTLLVPLLHTVMAEVMSTNKVALRSRRVAHRALHLLRSSRLFTLRFHIT